MQVRATLKTAILASALVASTVASIRLASADESYDLVIANGRVMDPESGLDAVRNVGIRGGKIRAISAGALKGASTIDAKGLVVTPGATHWEIVEMFRVAAKYNAPMHVHLRYAGLIEPETGLNAIEEVIAAAAATGAPLHVVHITSMGLKYTPQLIAMVEGTQRRGLDVTTECYPYTAASTHLQSAIFDPGWQEKLGIGFHE